MQPTFVVQQISLTGPQGQSDLMACRRGPQRRKVGLNDGTPACEPVEPQAKGHSLAAVGGEHLRGVTVSGSEERCAGLRQSQPDLPPTEEQVSVDGPAVGEQGLPSRHRGLPAYEEHQPGWIGCTGAFGVRIESAVAESREAGAVRVPAGVANGGEAVRVAIAVRYEVHHPGGEGKHGVARGEAIESDQTYVPQPRRDRRFYARRREVDAVVRESVGVLLMGSAHHGSPSLRCGAPTVRSHRAGGKATDCRLGQFAHEGSRL